MNDPNGSLVAVLVGNSTNRLAVYRVDGGLQARLEQRVPSSRWRSLRVLASGKTELRTLTNLMGDYSGHGLMDFETASARARRGRDREEEL